jgi:hypothetical protein
MGRAERLAWLGLAQRIDLPFFTIGSFTWFSLRENKFVKDYNSVFIHASESPTRPKH